MTAFVEICLFLVCLQLGYYLLFTLSAANKALKSKKRVWLSFYIPASENLISIAQGEVSLPLLKPFAKVEVRTLFLKCQGFVKTSFL